MARRDGVYCSGSSVRLLLTILYLGSYMAYGGGLAWTGLAWAVLGWASWGWDGVGSGLVGVGSG